MENAILRIAFHMECSPSLRSNRRFKLRVNLKFCQSYPEKSREKTEGHMAWTPRALNRVLSLELKGYLDYRQCPEWDLDLMYPMNLIDVVEPPRWKASSIGI
jgi:hypothetical protein